MRITTRLAAIGVAAFLAGPALAAGPQIVKGPGADTQCFKPWNEQTKFFQ
ncbi:MAG: hypothetical protein JO326_12405, partial [Acetobacteraceae bacterium]|nr:hypothetical protein [Acetobacteraceae bacterium]